MGQDAGGIPAQEPGVERRCSLGINRFFHGSYRQGELGLSGLDFKHPGAVFELVAGMEIGVVWRAGLPHFPKDFQPALAEASQRAGVALAALAKRIIIGRRPRTGLPAQVGPQMHGVAQRLVALSSQMDLVDLTALVADRRGASQALEAAWILKT